MACAAGGVDGGLDVVASELALLSHEDELIVRVQPRRSHPLHTARTSHIASLCCLATKMRSSCVNSPAGVTRCTTNEV